MMAALPNAAPPRLHGSIALRIVLGAHLRRMRESAGVSREQAGYAIRGSTAKISRLELGRVGSKERDITDLLTLFGVGDDERARLLELARQANAVDWWQRYGDVVPNWFETYVGLEQVAAVIRTYELQFVPGLLQTPDYARAVIRLQHEHDSRVDERVELRMRRQDVLTGPDAPVLWAVIDETALRRQLGGPDLCRAQLTHLIELSEHPNIRLQIAPLGSSGGHPAAGGSFSMLRFGHPDICDVVYLEQLTTAVYLDKREDVERYAAVMDQLCAQVEPIGRTVELLTAIREEL